MLKIWENMGTGLLLYIFSRSISILNQALKTEILQSTDDRREEEISWCGFFIAEKAMDG